MRRTAVALAVLGLVLLLARLTVVQPFRVASGSMAPAHPEGDVVLVLRGVDARPGDVVVADLPTGRAVKRVAAVGGQSVGIDDGRLCVDGRCRLEPWVDPRHVDGTFWGPVDVPPGHVVLLGDARDVSVDSRELGPLPVGDVVGRVVASW